MWRDCVWSEIKLTESTIDERDDVSFFPHHGIGELIERKWLVTTSSVSRMLQAPVQIKSVVLSAARCLDTCDVINKDVTRNAIEVKGGRVCGRREKRRENNGTSPLMCSGVPRSRICNFSGFE